MGISSCPALSCSQVCSPIHFFPKNYMLSDAISSSTSLVDYMANPKPGIQQEMAKDDLAPPTYCENTVAPESPATDMNATDSALDSAAFPSVMNGYYTYSLGGLKPITLCGANEEDRLYRVEMHSGYSMKPPLGTRPGVHTHNGPSFKDPIFAAAGDVSMMATKYYRFSLDGIILLPPLDDAMNSNMDYMVTETMRARTVQDDKDAVAFRFKIEVGSAASEKRQREEFEWRSVRKRDKDPDMGFGGFKLLHLSPDRESAGNKSSASGPAAPASSVSQPADQAGGEDKVVAILAWSKLTAIKHAFSLQLKGHGLSGLLGERWTVMVVATAVRLWVLHGTGKTTRTGIKIGEKLRNK
jgi:hypothetical protein